MSLNRFTSELPETLWWTTQMEPPSNSKTLISPLYHHHPPPSTVNNRPPYNSSNSTYNNFNLNQQDDNQDDQQLQENTTTTTTAYEEEPPPPREAMFEKPLTPSDVGKLNRLVIPKQHAEKFFPLGGDSVEKGLLLSFEDELGKSWRFRYSYWNSSQSYVLTKGWSRFVKEKRLDAGDVVLFERHRMDADRLFIGWRRRAVVVDCISGGLLVPQPHGSGGHVTVANCGNNAAAWTRLFYNAQAYPTHPGGGGGVANGPGSIPYQPDSLHEGSIVHNKSPTRTTPIRGNAKRSVRLFGVNLECEAEEEDEPATPDGSSISSQGQGPSQGQYFSTSNHHHLHHMDMNMCRDVNQMRYQYQFHQG